MTHTARTLAYLRKRDYQCDMIERWIPNPRHPAGGFRRDWMGFGDILAMGDGSIIAIQSCGQSYAEHDRKILELDTARAWLENGGRLMLIGWRKLKVKRGGSAMRWEPRIKEYTLEDFTNVRQHS